MGRRHRDMQQERRRAAASAPARRRPPTRGRRSNSSAALSRYLVDLVAILLIAVAVNLLLRELGVINSLLRIILALIAGRIIVSLGRRALDSRS